MKFKNYFTIILLSISVLLISGCGEGVVELDETYEPKIVVQALIFPGKKIENIYVTRNLPIIMKPGPISLFISNAEVSITDLTSNKEFKLVFNVTKSTYEYSGKDFTVEYDRSYKFSVHGTIDGKELSGSSITKTPKKGFSIIKSKTVSGEIPYYEKDSNGEVKLIPLVFNVSEGTTYYPVSIVALEASVDNFIYDNAYRQVDRKDVSDDLDNFKYRQWQIQNVNPNGSILEFQLSWMPFWFYSNYRMIVYAGDENYRKFMLTYRSVQEFDGNFHEPKINFSGDAIGVFASAIADTVYFRVKK